MDNEPTSNQEQKIVISDNLIQFYDLLLKVDRRLKKQKTEEDLS
jgi:hypothetical protein